MGDIIWLSNDNQTVVTNVDEHKPYFVDFSIYDVVYGISMTKYTRKDIIDFTIGHRYTQHILHKATY